MPSSARALKRYQPGSKVTRRVQRAEKLSDGMRESGDPVPQLKSMRRSLRTTLGLPSNLRLDQYSPFQSEKLVGVAGVSSILSIQKWASAKPRFW